MIVNLWKFEFPVKMNEINSKHQGRIKDEFQ